MHVSDNSLYIYDCTRKPLVPFSNSICQDQISTTSDVYTGAQLALSSIPLKSAYEKEAMHRINAHSAWDWNYIQFYGQVHHAGK